MVAVTLNLPLYSLQPRLAIPNSSERRMVPNGGPLVGCKVTIIDPTRKIHRL
jgi:hypothetical protein